MTKLLSLPANQTPVRVRAARKQQADRLLKQLPLSDRRRQQQIRAQIMHDLSFAAV